MSHQWIMRNLPDAVSNIIRLDIEKRGYSRHLLYVPFYLPAGVEHETALLKGDEHGHTDHAIPPTHHYHEADVAQAVAHKERKLQGKKTV